MYKTFDLFFEERDNLHFSNRFHNLCEDIALAEVPFQEYWHKHAIPVLMEGSFENEEELLNEFDWKNSKINPKNWGFSNSGRSWSGERDPQSDMIGRLDQHYQGIKDKEEAEKEARRQAHLATHQQTVDQTISTIKQEFVKQMRDFLGAMQTKSQQSNDYYGYKVAKSFHDRMMKAAQPVIDNFTMKAKYGQRDDGDFQSARQSMMQNQQAQMKQRLQQKHGSQPPNNINMAPPQGGGMHQKMN